jgi:hypothetical protein
MKQTLVEKIATKYAVGLEPGQLVRSGDFVTIRPKHVMTHDNTGAVIPKFNEMMKAAPPRDSGLGTRHSVSDPHQPVFAIDHDIQNTTPENLGKYAKIEKFAADNGIDFYPAGTGISHQVMVEQGYVVPGSMVVGSDSHSNLYGAACCLGTPVVRTDAASLWATGVTWWQVPPVARLYEICEAARDILRGEHEVGRVIARPFVGEPGAFKRTENRHDYAVPPPRDMLLHTLSGAGLDVVAVGKISSIYDAAGVTRELPGKNNDQSIDETIRALRDESRGLIFSNLVDFDMLYGHRRDVEGYARALEHFDARLPEIESAMREGDLLIITADHGNDPTYRGTDHTREYAPLLVYGPRARAGVNFGDRASLADIGQTIADNFGLRLKAGESFLSDIS